MCKILLFFLLFLFSPVLSDLLDLAESENEVFPSDDVDTKKAGNPRSCQPQTPCGWLIDEYLSYPKYYLRNDYCDCKEPQTCQFYLKRPEAGFQEFRCRHK